MQRLTKSFFLLNLHACTQNVCLRGISNKNLVEKLGLPEKPKKPLTPYLAFYASVRTEVKSKNPNAGNSEISQIVGKRWQELSIQEKDKYAEEYKKNFERYKIDLGKYRESLTEAQEAEIKEAEKEIKLWKEQRRIKLNIAKRNKQLSKPKKPLSAFFRFLISQDKGPGLLKDHMKIMGKKWSALPDTIKEKYKAEFNEEYRQFNKDLENWENEMIKQGHPDLVRPKTLKEKLKKAQSV